MFQYLYLRPEIFSPLFPAGCSVSAGHTRQRSGGHIVAYLCVIVGTRCLIRPLLPCSTQTHPNTIAHLIISISAPPDHSMEGPGSRSQAVQDHGGQGPFVRCNICTLADTVCHCDLPTNHYSFFPVSPASLCSSYVALNTQRFCVNPFSKVIVLFTIIVCDWLTALLFSVFEQVLSAYNSD